MVSIKHIRTKVLIFILGVMVSLFSLVAYSVFQMRSVVNTSERIYSVYFPLQEVMNEADNSMFKGSAILAGVFTAEYKPSEFNNVNKDIGQIRSEIIRFSMFVEAAKWGSESDAFKAGSGGLLNALWRKRGYNKDHVIRKAPDHLRHKLGTVGLHFSGFSNSALMVLKGYRKYLRM